MTQKGKTRNIIPALLRNGRNKISSPKLTKIKVK